MTRTTGANNDGVSPQAGLVTDGQGNFYGVTIVRRHERPGRDFQVHH